MFNGFKNLYKNDFALDNKENPFLTKSESKRKLKNKQNKQNKPMMILTRKILP